MNVLVVEGDPDVRELLEDVLAPEFEVRSCSTVGEAARWLLREPVDVLLADLDLREAGGEELARVARTVRRPIGVVLMSGNPVRLELHRSLADAVVPKPFPVNGVHAALRQAVTRVRGTHVPQPQPRHTSWRSLAGAVIVAGLATASCQSLPSAPTDEPASMQGQWALVSLAKGSAAATPAPSGATFTATFGTDGRLNLRADCNLCNGGYTAGAGTLAVADALACTRAYCPTAPFDSDYATLVVAAKRWAVQGGELELSSDAGRLRFRR